MKQVFVSSIAAGFIALFGMLYALTPIPAEATQEGSYQGIAYLTGGVGEDERKEIEEAAKDYNLKLVFAQEDGAFVSNVQVTVKSDAGSTILEAMATGPLFYAKLPAGNYLVEVSYEGVARQSSASVAATGQHVLDFRW